MVVVIGTVASQRAARIDLGRYSARSKKPPTIR
jgi:hypothetical protein